MSDQDLIRSDPASAVSGRRIAEQTSGSDSFRPARVAVHPIYNWLWWTTQVLLLVSILLVVYTTMWEYSTRRYLQGFSDAVIPAAATPEEKIEAILIWMSSGPARRSDPIGVAVNRDPTATLNYQALLRVCGSATNAFINLADSSGLSARRLLLLDSNRGTRHVVAEVMLDGRWIVVDPTFRTILRGANGQFLTRHDLADLETFSLATQNIPHYDPSYNYGATEHVRVERVPILGPGIRKLFDLILPKWQDSSTMSLFLERESFAAAITSVLLLLFLVLFRISLRWYGEARLGIRTVRVREQMRRAFRAFVTQPT
jgi:Transglutaminase-like superfamily